jgi:putative transposase
MRTNTNWETVRVLEDKAKYIDCKEHFKLEDNAKIEFSRYRKTRHSTYNINYHFVWIPKTRMKVLTKPFDGFVEQTIKRVCSFKNWEPLALQVMPDHVHFFVSAPPKFAPCEIVQCLKAWTSKDLREKFATIRNLRFKDDFWASSYYCGTAGLVSAETIAKYIAGNAEY